jgi:hypothetical protein
MLEMEIGDVLAMVDILIEHNFIDQDKLNNAKENKRNKLKTWSNIFK